MVNRYLPIIALLQGAAFVSIIAYSIHANLADQHLRALQEESIRIDANRRQIGQSIQPEPKMPEWINSADPTFGADSTIKAAIAAHAEAKLWQAERLYKSALAKTTPDPTSYRRTIILKLLGDVLVSRTDHEKAIEFYQKALETMPAESRNDKLPLIVEDQILTPLISMQCLTEQFDDAYVLSRKQLQLRQQLNANKLALLEMFSRLSTLSRGCHDKQAALRYYDQAIAIADSLGEPVWKKLVVLRIEKGELLSKANQMPAAIECFRAAVSVAQRTQESDLITRAEGTLGKLLPPGPERDRLALKLFEFDQRRALKTVAPYIVVGEWLVEHGRLAEARSVYERGLACAEHRGMPSPRIHAGYATLCKKLGMRQSVPPLKVKELTTESDGVE